MRLRHLRHLYAPLMLIAAGAVLDACSEIQLLSHTAKVMDQDGGPSDSGPHASAPLPTGYKLGEAYQVAGATYYPYYDPHFVEQGIASWYGPDFHGRNTANGEPFDMNALTGAHKTLPLPSTVRITNLENGRQILVRVNDRGPFVNGRIIDLSRRSAQLLGFYGTGTAKVRLEFVGLAPLQETAYAEASQSGNVTAAPRAPVDTETIADPPAQSRSNPIGVAAAAELPNETPVRLTPTGPAEKANLFVQVGAFANADKAGSLRGSLARFGQASLAPARVGGRTLYRVRLGPFTRVDQANTLLDRLLRSGYRTARLVVDDE
jgi:rare lipoprotein A